MRVAAVLRSLQNFLQLELQRRQFWLPAVEQIRIEPGVPVADSDEQCDGGQYRLAERKYNSRKNDKVVGSVQLGRLLQRIRQAVDIRANDIDIPDA